VEELKPLIEGASATSSAADGPVSKSAAKRAKQKAVKEVAPSDDTCHVIIRKAHPWNLELNSVSCLVSMIK
jgi:hypothetical protein